MNHKNTNPPLSGPVPFLLNEAAAAALLDESEQTRRLRRYEDQKRLGHGEPIHGPVWIKDGKRVKYRLRDVRDYADRIPTVLDAYPESSDVSSAA